MKQISNFFERILQILEFYDIKSINSFAIEHLKYDSSEKINRLKKDNTYPSYQILCDITNKFEEINVKWLLTGRGEMIIVEEKRGKEEKTTDVPIQIVDKNSFGFILDRYEALVAENTLQKREIESLKIENSKRIENTPYISNQNTDSIAAEPK